MPGLPALGSRRTFTVTVSLTFKATQGEDSVASRLWLLGHCGLEAGAWRDVEQVHGHRCVEQRSSKPWRRERPMPCGPHQKVLS